MLNWERSQTLCEDHFDASLEQHCALEYIRVSWKYISRFSSLKNEHFATYEFIEF